MTDSTSEEDLMLNLDEVNKWFRSLDQKMAQCRLVFESKIRPVLNQVDEREIADEMQASIDGLISEFSGMLTEESEPLDNE